MAKKNDSSLAVAESTKIAEWRETMVPKDLDYAGIAKTLSDAGELASAAEYGTGFEVLDTKEKGRLVGVPFIVLDWDFHEGDNGDFVSLQVITNANEKLIINDGSTGIFKQMWEINAAGEARAIFVKKGLRRSDYEYTDRETGAKKPATTFYLDTSA